MTSKLLFGKFWRFGVVCPVVVLVAAVSSPVATATDGSSWFVTGTYKGQTLQGPVTVATVTCAPISVGGSNGVQVIWGGTVRNNATGASEQISGDMSFPQLGAWSIPTNDPHTPTASMVVAGDYQDRYGLSSGTGGLGSGNLTANATGGTVDATYSTGSEMLSLKGSWTCAGATPTTSAAPATPTPSPTSSSDHRTPTIERQTAQQDLLDAIEAAKGPCLQEAAALGTLAAGGVTMGVLGAIPGGLPAGGALNATGQVWAAVAGPMCTPIISRIAKDVAIINDPPDPAIHDLPKAAPVAAVASPSCTGVDSGFASYCQKLSAAAAKVATDARAVAAVTDAIATAVARESGANAAGDTSAASDQQQNAQTLVNQLGAALRAQTADGAAMAHVVRSEHVSMSLTTDQSSQAIQVLLADLAKQGVTADQVRPLAGSTLTPASVDLVNELAHPGLVKLADAGGGGAPVGLILGLAAAALAVIGGVAYAARRRLLRSDDSQALST